MGIGKNASSIFLKVIVIQSVGLHRRDMQLVFLDQVHEALPIDQCHRIAALHRFSLCLFGKEARCDEDAINGMYGVPFMDSIGSKTFS